MSTVNQAFKRFFPEYAISHKLSSQQAKAAKNIMQCKTSAMGGNASVCHECGHTEIHYNSCRDRHCPLCQGVTKAVWVDQRCKEVLNTPYFHVVFTIPEQLRMVTYHNKKLLDRKSTRLNSSHVRISYAVFCLKKKKKQIFKIF